MSVRALVVAVAVLSVAPSLGSGTLAAQGRFGDEETRLLREAAALESAGDLAGAEASLRRLIEMDPVSTGGIYALERVLRQKGGLDTLLPLVDGYLTRREDSGIRSLKLQLLVEAGELDEMVEEAEWWLARARRDETAYAEVARAYQAAFGPDRALEVLVLGRATLGGDALALAMGDHFAEQGDLDGAVDEWARAVGPDGSNVLAVRRRVEGLAEGETNAARRLVETLADSEFDGRRRAAAGLALELALGPEALDLVRRQASALDGRQRVDYLQEISVAATAAGVAQVASWAYEELGRSAEDPDDRRLLEQRRAEAALEAGDTIAALDAFAGVAASLPTGSNERRFVEARTIRTLASTSRMDRLKTSWAEFREAYPSAGELDALAAVTAAALIAWGDVDGAVTALDGIEGPRSAIERAYLLLGGGEIEAGRGTLMEAAGALPPTEAIEVIQLAGLLGRVSPQAAQALANAGVLAHLGRGGSAGVALADQAFDFPVGDRPLLMAEAARMADRAGERAAAADIRARLVAEYPDAPEVGEASLALARHLAREEGDPEAAIRMLEDLITRQPNGAVVPEARLELERLHNRGS